METIQKKELKETTIKNYKQSFTKFMKLLNKPIEYLFLNSDDVIKFIQKAYPNIGTQKTILSTILYELKNEKYNNINKDKAVKNYKNSINDIAIYIKNTYETKEKTIKENKNWISWDDVVNIFKINYNKIKDGLKNPKLMNYENFNQIQSIVILSMYIYIPPRRGEYINILLSNYDVNNDNFIIPNDKIILNKYKTSDTKEGYIINLKKNKLLNNILNEFIKLRNINNFKSNYLFISDKDKNMDHSQLAKRLNKIFDKKISISMLRKIYLNEKYNKNIDLVEEMIKTTEDMGTSVNTMNIAYLKK